MEPEMNGTNENPKCTKWTGDKNKTENTSKWTLPETFVLIEAKKIAEKIRQKGRTSGVDLGSEKKERKWEFVSSHCIRQGVNRCPSQCSRRWQNILRDFRKIKKRESELERGCISYWLMNENFRRQLKLPPSFKSEIYNVLDVKPFKEDENFGGPGCDGLEVEDVDEMMEEEADAVRYGTTPSAAADSGTFIYNHFSGAIHESPQEFQIFSSAETPNSLYQT